MSGSQQQINVSRPIKRGTQCCAYGCTKRKKSRQDQLDGRSDSEGSEDEESALKRCHPRTFHAFPIDPDRRKSWLVHLHRQKWKPSSHSRVCSDHFIESDIDRTGQVVRLRTEAIPTRLKNLPKHLRKATKSREPPCLKVSEKKDVQEPKQLENNSPENNQASPTTKVQLDDHQYHIKDSPKQLTGKLHNSNEKIAILQKKLKHAQQKSRRLQLKVKILKDTVKNLRKKQMQLQLATSHQNSSSVKTVRKVKQKTKDTAQHPAQ